ncbi:hypothetical protein GCM10007884_35530 [Methylobacterium brachythecii]|uniref:Uncharacterized protein n=1 Tax=Methylobacterium brachythecii TaxID=1176177 RepID=A0ABQ6D610_9HYPH|nr:hypothetical protein GCM10007884_35530 [Methylobacterium brachythecii]
MPNRLAQTESTLATTDRLWRAEMKRHFGPDGVLLHGFGPDANGLEGTQLRTTHEARQRAIVEWRHERRS